MDHCTTYTTGSIVNSYERPEIVLTCKWSCKNHKRKLWFFPKWCMNCCLYSSCQFAWVSWMLVPACVHLVLHSYSYICVWCIGVGWEWKSVLRDADRHTAGWGRRGSGATRQTAGAFLSVCLGYTIQCMLSIHSSHILHGQFVSTVMCLNRSLCLRPVFWCYSQL